MLEKQGVAERWTRPLERLDDRVDRIIIWDTWEMEESQWSTLLQWVEAGGVAVIGGYLPYLDGVVTEGEPEPGRSAAAHPVNLNITDLDLGPGRFVTDQGHLVHVTDPMGTPVLISWPQGSGRIFRSADTEWLSNQRIAEAQNLDLALHLLLPPRGGGMVAFDEYHHGFRSADRWWQILRGPLQAFLLMLMLALALLYWSYGARFGSPRPTPPGPPRAAVEYVHSMSQLYRRAQARRIVLQTLYRSLTLELGKLLGGIRGLTHAQIAERTAHRAKVAPAVIESLLDRLNPDRGQTPSEAELIALARETEDLQRRMQHGGYRDQRDA